MISDEDFLKLDTDAVMSRIDQVVNEYAKQQYASQEPTQENNTTGTEPSTTSQDAIYEPVQPQDTTSQEDTNSAPNQSESINYEEAYKKITSPFKANGKDFQVRNIDEAVALMQKGVDYTRKLQSLQPRLREMKALEQQNMLEGNLNYAIDLYNGKPEALAKLIKDKGIDVNKLVPNTSMDGFGGESEQPAPYIPTDYSISQERYELSEVMDEFKANGTINHVLSSVTALGDDGRAEFQKNPGMLRELENHINTGLYDKIMGELEHRKLVNDPSIQNLSTFQAYTQIGTQILQQQNQARAVPQEPVQQQYTQQQQQYAQQQAIQARKQGATTSRPSVPVNPGIAQYDPLRCSDEDFAKIDIKQLMQGFRL